MCSIEDGGELYPERNNDQLSGSETKNCVKCGCPGVVVIRVNDSFCKSCFQVYVIHKFRAAIGKSKLIRIGERVIVAFSGGDNSAALLHLIQDGLSERAHKKLRFIPIVLHVDESGVAKLSCEQRQVLRHKLQSLMLKSGFPSYIVNLEEALRMVHVSAADHGQNCVSAADHGQNCVGVGGHPDLRLMECMGLNLERDSGLPSLSEQEELCNIISSLDSNTSRDSFIKTLRNQLLVSVARQLGILKVLTAECSTRLSICILSDMAQGRGSQVSLDTSFSDHRNGDIAFVRPVRDLKDKELNLYNQMFNVDSITPLLCTKTFPGDSIDRLTETFVTGLQTDFLSTVANIVRTSEKLEPPNLDTDNTCSFCKSPLDTDVGKASALKAIMFSQRISQSLDPTSVSGPLSLDGHKSLSFPELYKTLCYGCNVTLQNYNSQVSTLPNFLVLSCTRQLSRDKVREAISHLLLDDDDDEADQL